MLLNYFEKLNRKQKKYNTQFIKVNYLPQFKIHWNCQMKKEVMMKVRLFL